MAANAPTVVRGRRERAHAAEADSSVAEAARDRGSELAHSALEQGDELAGEAANGSGLAPRLNAGAPRSQTVDSITHYPP